jgi:hypothetical protein
MGVGEEDPFDPVDLIPGQQFPDVGRGVQEQFITWKGEEDGVPVPDQPPALTPGSRAVGAWAVQSRDPLRCASAQKRDLHSGHTSSVIPS